ncbi:MAG: MFS transporter [Acidimicrobiia bacterium]|nr:MFS transporter [Acidimicrobiia bacterium]
MTTVLQRSAFVRLQVANVSSGVANGVVMIAVPWLVLERTDSPARAGLLAALVSLPGIFVSPIVGGLIDRVGRRAISALSDVLSCLSVLLFVIGEVLGTLGFVLIAVFAVLGAVFDPAGYTARKALIPNAAEAAGMSVEKANGRHEGFFAVGWMLGPAVGAWCIEAGGPTLAFAVTSGQRSSALPDIPTVEEAGRLKGFEASSWFGLLAPAGTSADIVNRIQREVARALSDPGIKEKMQAQGAIPSGMTPQEFVRLIDSEHSKWAQVVKASGAKAD